MLFCTIRSTRTPKRRALRLEMLEDRTAPATLGLGNPLTTLPNAAVLSSAGATTPAALSQVNLAASVNAPLTTTILETTSLGTFVGPTGSAASTRLLNGVLLNSSVTASLNVGVSPRPQPLLYADQPGSNPPLSGQLSLAFRGVDPANLSGGSDNEVQYLWDLPTAGPAGAAAPGDDKVLPDEKMESPRGEPTDGPAGTVAPVEEMAAEVEGAGPVTAFQPEAGGVRDRIFQDVGDLLHQGAAARGHSLTGSSWLTPWVGGLMLAGGGCEAARRRWPAHAEDEDVLWNAEGEPH